MSITAFAFMVVIIGGWVSKDDGLALIVGQVVSLGALIWLRSPRWRRSW